MTPHAVLRSNHSTGQKSCPVFSPRSRHSPAPAIKRLAAFSLALILVPASQADLFAQQAPYSPGPQQPYSYNDQYDPSQQYQQPDAPPPPDYGYQQGYDQPQPGYGQQRQGLSADQLEQMVAPLALYPDQLVALMLAASTYPSQVQDADNWRQAQGYVSSDQIAYGASLQAWDPSVKALTAFPQVLAEMDQNIQWTATLGNAYYNQPRDVLQAIQIMRQRAQAAGNLQSTPQEEVNYNQGYIQVAPVNPQVIYVPAYNPWTVYGQPVDPYPGFSLVGAIGSFAADFGSVAVQFGVGTVISAFTSTPFGLLAWGLDWLGQCLLFNHSDYYSHSDSVRDWGLPYGGPRAHWAAHREFAGYNGYGRGYGQGFNRGYNSRNQQGYNRGYQSYNRGYGSNYNSNYRNGLYSRSYNRTGSAYAGRGGYAGGGPYPSWNRSFAPIRPQPVGRSAYGSNYGYGSNYRSNFNNRSQLAYSGRAGLYNSNRGGFNQSFYNSNRGSFNQRSAYRGNAFAGNGFNGASGKSSHSGGFHPFGGGHNSNGFGGGQSFRAPKAPKGFGGGGHSFGGGGHSFGGGGHSFGGGHSHGGGGGGGGGHGGGGHHSGGGHHH